MGLDRGASSPVRGPAAAVREWGHVRLFSPWSELIDPVAEKLLTESGWTSPDPAAYPTGHDWVERYLAPLAELLAQQPGVEIHYGHRVVGVARAGRDRLVAIGRDEVPFTRPRCDPRGPHEVLTACAVIDASGTWGTPNPLGGDGYLADGEAEHADQILYGIPDLTVPPSRPGTRASTWSWPAGAPRLRTPWWLWPRWPSRQPGTRVTWLVRRGDTEQGLRRRRQRPARARGALGNSAKQAVEDGPVTTVTGFRTSTGRGPADGPTDARLDRRAAGQRRRRGDRRDRVPARPLVALRGAPRPRRRAVGPVRARARDPPGVPLLRFGLPARRQPAAPARGRPLPRGDEVLRPRAVIPDPDRVRADPQRRRRDRRRLRVG